MTVKLNSETYTAVKEIKSYIRYSHTLVDLLNKDFEFVIKKFTDTLYKLSKEELVKIFVYDDYELEKEIYTINSLPFKFKFKHKSDKVKSFTCISSHYHNCCILMWIKEDGELEGITYNYEDVVEQLNEGNWIITEEMKK